MPERPLPSTIGLVAGQGEFPVLLCRGAKEAGVRVVVFGVHGLANPVLEAEGDWFYTLRLTELSRLFELCRQHGVSSLIMAGRVPHKVLLKQVSLDPRVLRLMGRIRNNKADSLLKAATQEIEAEGIEVLDSTLFLKSCLPKPGLLTPRAEPSAEVMADMMFGYPIAKEIARLDIGQSIAVKNRIVVAVEGIEGTDQLIQRAGELAGEGVVIVKVSKPRQDMRFDVPVVGLTTIKHLCAAKAAGLCVTANESLFLNREEAVALAHSAGISLYAYQESGTETPFDDSGF